MEKITQCPLCEVESLESLFRNREITVNGWTASVDNLEYSRCNCCGAVTVTPEQSKHNKEKILEVTNKLPLIKDERSGT